jgi:putative aminopeptidase
MIIIPAVMRFFRICAVVAAALVLLAWPVPAAADTARRLHDLIAIPGLSGYEARVREAIEMLLPVNARVRADNLGNIVMRTGNGTPHTLIVAPLDESGFVVSAITDAGYLRVHRHTTAPAPRLGTQYYVGQPIEVRTAAGGIVPGVTATPSAHLRAMRDQADEARIKTIDDIWIDVGAESRAEVERLGVRLLDSVTLRERATMLAGGRVSGVAAAGRAAALAMAEIIRRSSGRGATGSVTLAWVTQSEYGNRGLLRLLEQHRPDRLMVMRGSMNPGDEPRGAIGQLGSGPVVRDGGINLPDKWKALPVQTLMVPVLFAQTPVETVDGRDVDALAERVASAVGLPPLAPPAYAPPTPDGASAGKPIAAAGEPVSAKAAATKDTAFETLGALIETYGVSAHEVPVREQVLKRLPAWAKPQVDGKGNVVVSFGSGGKPLLFMAHMDEVGFDITNVAADGTAAVRVRGGMYLSTFESHPVIVQTAKGPVRAVLAPRTGYTSAKEAQPAANALYVYFGTGSAAETTALGIAAGDSLTVKKTFAPLATHRATGRSMDDRNGSAALLLALQQINPKTVTNQVTFAWTVEEETGLAGAAYLAERMKPDAAFAIDTFVSTDTPVDIQRLAGARLGHGAVLRVLDSRTIVPPHIVDRIVAIARAQKVPLQLGTTSGGTDGSVFSAGGAIDVGLSWPGRYSHSPVEIMDRRDLDSLVKLIVAVAKSY